MILITGASSGIGEATAHAFARDRRSLYLIARRKDRLESVRKRCLELGAPKVEIAEIDLRDLKTVEAHFQKLGPQLESLEVLVNNAGLARGMDPFQDAEWADLNEMVQVNVLSLIQVTRLVLPYLIRRNAGHIVNLGSVAGRIAYPKGHVYCATKAAIRSFTETLRLDLNGTAIRVTEIAPGMVETEFSEVRFGDAERAKKVYAGMQPLTATDIADAIFWAATRPPHVNIQEIVLYPTAQASPTVVHR